MSSLAPDGVAIEITTGYLPHEIDDGRLDCALRFLGLAKQAGCLFTFGSDAHAPEKQQLLSGLEPLTTSVGITEEE